MQTDSSNPLRIVMVEKRLSDLLALYSRQVELFPDLVSTRVDYGLDYRN